MSYYRYEPDSQDSECTKDWKSRMRKDREDEAQARRMNQSHAQQSTSTQFRSQIQNRLIDTQVQPAVPREDTDSETQFNLCSHPAVPREDTDSETQFNMCSQPKLPNSQHTLSGDNETIQDHFAPSHTSQRQQQQQQQPFHVINHFYGPNVTVNNCGNGRVDLRLQMVGEDQVSGYNSVPQPFNQGPAGN